MPSSKKSNSTGLFFSFEGAEGSGKSTQIELLTKKLTSKGLDTVVTREPGGTPLGEKIRKLLIHGAKDGEMFPETELLLFAASRAQLVREVLVPALQLGKIILCDRFLDSTTVYQGVARSLSPDPVQQINHFAVGAMLPNLTFVLDVPPETSLERLRQRGHRPPDRMERESIDFYRKVREGYLLLAQSLPNRFHVLDGTRPVEKLEKDIWKTVSTYLKA